MSTNTLLVAGLPGSGKTTFLAALWHVADGQEIPQALHLDHLSDEIRHLNNIKNDWHLCVTAGRSILAKEHYPSLWLTDPSSGMIGEIVFPDLEGEIFRDQWKNREWPAEYQTVVQKADRIVLFIHARDVNEPLTIAEVQKLAESAHRIEREDNDPPSPADALLIEDDEDQQQTGAIVPWDAEKAPTQVQLVGILQFLEPYILPKKPVRLAVIISAWDYVAATKNHPSPEVWLQDRLPYLDQYLRSHFELFEVRKYGVSAQGGDFGEDVAKLQTIQPASNRIIVEGPDCAPHDITEPVRWALGWRA